MTTKKPKPMKQRSSDDYQTPKEAVDIIIPYLNKDWIIWECAWGQGALSNHLKKEGFNVIGDKNIDFLDKSQTPLHFDCIVTNPPYSLKDEFLEQCYKLNKPFALLMPLTALEGIYRGKLYQTYGIQLIIPNRRINFIPKSNKSGGVWFQTAWFCYDLNLPKDLLFVELKRKSK